MRKVIAWVGAYWSARASRWAAEPASGVRRIVSGERRTSSSYRKRRSSNILHLQYNMPAGVNLIAINVVYLASSYGEDKSTRSKFSRSAFCSVSENYGHSVDLPCLKPDLSQSWQAELSSVSVISYIPKIIMRTRVYLIILFIYLPVLLSYI
jgi:hypothetical protein